MKKEVLDPLDLRPKAGELVENWINEKLIPFIKSRDIVDVGPNGFYTIGRRGTSVRYKSDPPLRGRFVVSATETELRVSVGFIDGVMPTLKGVYLDGSSRVAEGTSQGDAPLLEIEYPGTEFSFACIKLATDNGKPLVDEYDYLTITHAPEPLSAFRREQGQSVGIWPLARLRWSEDGRLLYSRQIVTHNLSHFWIPGGIGKPGFHDFRATG